MEFAYYEIAGVISKRVLKNFIMWPHMDSHMDSNGMDNEWKFYPIGENDKTSSISLFKEGKYERIFLSSLTYEEACKKGEGYLFIPIKRHFMDDDVEFLTMVKLLISQRKCQRNIKSYAHRLNVDKKEYMDFYHKVHSPSYKKEKKRERMKILERMSSNYTSYIRSMELCMRNKEELREINRELSQICKGKSQEMYSKACHMASEVEI